MATNWEADPDWCAIAKNAAHPQHHIEIDRYGTYICRECSRTRLYVLRDDEVRRLLLVDRVPGSHPTRVDADLEDDHRGIVADGNRDADGSEW